MRKTELFQWCEWSIFIEGCFLEVVLAFQLGHLKGQHWADLWRGMGAQTWRIQKLVLML
jgi:hypothetical protein